MFPRGKLGTGRQSPLPLWNLIEQSWGNLLRLSIVYRQLRTLVQYLLAELSVATWTAVNVLPVDVPKRLAPCRRTLPGNPLSLVAPSRPITLG